MLHKVGRAPRSSPTARSSALHPGGTRPRLQAHSHLAVGAISYRQKAPFFQSGWKVYIQNSPCLLTLQSLLYYFQHAVRQIHSRSFQMISAEPFLHTNQGPCGHGPGPTHTHSRVSEQKHTSANVSCLSCSPVDGHDRPASSLVASATHAKSSLSFRLLLFLLELSHHSAE